MTPGVKLNNKDIIEAMRKTNGNLTLTGQLIGCSREAIRLRVNKYPELKEVMDESRESVIDVAEGALQRAVLNGEGWAIALTLKTIGKNRGYMEKTIQEITGKDGEPLNPKQMTDAQLIAAIRAEREKNPSK